MQGLFVENFHVIGAVPPSADIYNGDPDSDVINMKNFDKVVFLVAQKANATSTAGTAVVKVKACSSAAGSSAENVPFKYSKRTTGLSDTMGSVSTAVAADGFTTTANEDSTYVIEVDSRDMPATKPYVSLDFTESVNAPVIGAVIALGVGGSYGAPFATALT